MSSIFHWKEKKTWPVRWPKISVEPDSDEAYALAQRFAERYEYLRVYHACRPLDPSTYYQDGLRIADHEQLLQYALALFANGQFPAISKDDVIHAASRSSGIDNHRVYVALDDRLYIEDGCGHYLIYGSEFICGIAAALSGRYGPDYRQHLKTIGRPTIFEIHLPVSWVDERTLAELASDIARAKSERSVADLMDFTITLQESVPPEYIRSHYHPTRIIDPLLRMTPYIYHG